MERKRKERDGDYQRKGSFGDGGYGAKTPIGDRCDGGKKDEVESDEESNYSIPLL